MKPTLVLRRPNWFLGIGVWLAVPTWANAHSATPGANSIYVGLVHPLQNLSHVLVLLGLGIWLGQSQPLRLKTPMPVFMVCGALALAVTTRMTGPAAIGHLLIALAMGLGVLVASAAELPPWSRLAVVGAAAVAIGMDSGLDGTPSAGSLALTLLGTWISTSVLVANIAYYISVCPQRKWVQIGIRIAGSWIAAVSLMVLAFLIKGPSPA